MIVVFMFPTEDMMSHLVYMCFNLKKMGDVIKKTIIMQHQIWYELTYNSYTDIMRGAKVAQMIQKAELG